MVVCTILTIVITFVTITIFTARFSYRKRHIAELFITRITAKLRETILYQKQDELNKYEEELAKRNEKELKVLNSVTEELESVVDDLSKESCLLCFTQQSTIDAFKKITNNDKPVKVNPNNLSEYFESGINQKVLVFSNEYSWKEQLDLMRGI